MYIAFQFHESTADNVSKCENIYKPFQDWHEMNRNPPWLPIWMMVHMWSSQDIPQRVDAMLIYSAASVNATPTYNTYMYIHVILTKIYQLLYQSIQSN